MQVLNSSVARPWKLEQNTSGQASRQALRMQVLNSSVARPWKLEQNTSGQASRQALRASRLWKLEQKKQYDKEGALFWTSKRKKKQARKNGPPQYPLCPSPVTPT